MKQGPVFSLTDFEGVFEWCDVNRGTSAFNFKLYIEVYIDSNSLLKLFIFLHCGRMKYTTSYERAPARLSPQTRHTPGRASLTTEQPRDALLYRFQCLL